MIGVAVVGYGYWGPNLVRNLSEAAGTELIAVCDLNLDRLAAVRGRYPSVAVTDDYEAICVTRASPRLPSLRRCRRTSGLP